MNRFGQAAAWTLIIGAIAGAVTVAADYGMLPGSVRPQASAEARRFLAEGHSFSDAVLKPIQAKSAIFGFASTIVPELTQPYTITGGAGKTGAVTLDCGVLDLYPPQSPANIADGLLMPDRGDPLVYSVAICAAPSQP